jgi:hypothetical protein
MDRGIRVGKDRSGGVSIAPGEEASASAEGQQAAESGTAGAWEAAAGRRGRAEDEVVVVDKNECPQGPFTTLLLRKANRKS